MGQNNGEFAGETTADYGYSILIHLPGGSVGKHLPDSDLPCIWADEYFYDLIGYPKSVYESLLHNRPSEYSNNNPDSLRVLTDAIRDSLSCGMSGASCGALYKKSTFKAGAERL